MEARSRGDSPVARRPDRDWFALALCVLSMAVAVFFFAGVWRAAARSPHRFAWSLLTLAVAAGGFVLLVIVLAAWQAARDRHRATRAFRWSFWLLIAAGMSYLGSLALDSTSLAARRAQPIADAIVRFEADHGAAPASLEELVPDYLLSVPVPFTSTFHHVLYQRNEKQPGAWLLRLTGSPQWRLAYLELAYEPGTATPRRRQHHSVAHPPERFGDWVRSESPF